MSLTKAMLTVLTSGLLAVACSPVSSEQVHHDVVSSVDANEKAQTLNDWEASEYNPETLFKKWHDLKADPQAVCEAFAKKSAKDLTLFEEEIKNTENAELIAPCKDDLIAKMETYWAEQKKQLEIMPEIPEKSADAPELAPQKAPKTPPISAPSETASPEKENVPAKPVPKTPPAPLKVPEKPTPLKAPEKSAPSKTSAPANDFAATFRFPLNVQVRDVSQGYAAVRGDVGSREVILTFDDGPHPQYTDRILAALGSVDAKAIFFAMGNSVESHPEVLKRVAAAGHSIGSHSMTHRCLANNANCRHSNGGKALSFADAVAEIKGGHQAVYNALGWVDPFFRFPYGEASNDLKEYLRSRGVGQFAWNIDSNDWKNRSPQAMLVDTLDQIERQGRGIVLFHDIQRKTAEVLPQLLKQLYFRGYSVVVLKSANPEDRQHSRLVRR